MKLYKHYIFDLDDTLVDAFNGTKLRPGRAKKINALCKESKKKRNITPEFAIATNQGGVGLRHWMEVAGFGEPKKLPTSDDVLTRLSAISRELWEKCEMAYLELKCFAYVSKKGGVAPQPDWANNPQYQKYWHTGNRKPKPGMLIEAMVRNRVGEANTIFIGDNASGSDADRKAASAAGIDFMYADEFFGKCRESKIIAPKNRLTNVTDQLDRESAAELADIETNRARIEESHKKWGNNPHYYWNESRQCYMHNSTAHVYDMERRDFGGGYSEAR